jgi:hypothetical protein
VLLAGALIWLALEAMTRVVDLAHRAVVVILAAVLAVAVVRVARGRRS